MRAFRPIQQTQPPPPQKSPSQSTPCKKLPQTFPTPSAGGHILVPMPSFTRLRRHPDFAGFFDLVHPFFWPVLFWQLIRASKYIAKLGCREALVDVNGWGFVTIAFLGDRDPSPSAYRPLVATRKAWDDPCWSTSLPVDLLPEAQPLFFPCTGGGSGRAQSALTKGVCTFTPHADTS
ncbi:hypothetical protein HNE_2923 [Hyphomonas neptunium ATCC 15444]|uniref:Uncharacterized protein n=2 Tax=Hyphomonas TaxID=85 RepID=Q0BY42_HYPNA|nr:hypothetical protein HNE_2923 [Hyphomonas neptunium ATCC 15444]